MNLCTFWRAIWCRTKNDKYQVGMSGLGNLTRWHKLMVTSQRRTPDNRKGRQGLQGQPSSELEDCPLEASEPWGAESGEISRSRIVRLIQNGMSWNTLPEDERGVILVDSTSRSKHWVFYCQGDLPQWTHLHHFGQFWKNTIFWRLSIFHLLLSLVCSCCRPNTHMKPCGELEMHQKIF